MSDITLSEETLAGAPVKRKLNWPLLIGVFLVILIIAVAIFGPQLAPNDPREQKLIIQIEGKWLKPPYPAFTPGYLLGSDNLGRDLFSWLLWSIRPTMILVALVALIRMLLGVCIGIGAGWSDRWPGRLCDILIAAALSAPALITALVIITAVGFRLGVWAFVVGLAVTGWAETAQLVREQTRTIRGQQAVEAALALGASSGQTFLLHILPHIMPMVWMLLAYEVSHTLVTTAGLGFLGYYLGGAVFTEVDDFVYQRISEMPELGQMLATAWLVLDEPWAMVAAGSAVFVIVLAFNLVGEGLQQRLTRKLGGPRSLYTWAAEFVAPWLERLAEPLRRLRRTPAFGPVVGVLSVMLVLAGGLWLRELRISDDPALEPTPGGTLVAAEPSAVPGTEQPTASLGELPSALSIPGGHIYPNEYGDPWHARYFGFTGPVTNTIQWTFEREAGFTGGPVVDAQGRLYINSRDGRLIALQGDATVLWETSVVTQPVGSPAIAADGTVYVADKQGLSAFSPEGQALWRFTSDAGAGPTASPVVSPDGSVYYKSYSALFALSAEGQLRWQAVITGTASIVPPHLSPAGDVIYWQSMALNTGDGSLYDWKGALRQGRTLSQAFVGADGKTYLRYAEAAYRSLPADDGVEETLLFDWSMHTYEASDAGVMPDGRPWLLARPSSRGIGLGLYWGDETGLLVSRYSVADSGHPRVVGIDARSVTYVCTDIYSSDSMCVAVLLNRALWQAKVRGARAFAGAALAPGRLYVATFDGKLVAIGEAEGESEPIVEEQPLPPMLISAEPAWSQPEVSGGHPWPMERRDVWGTRWAPFAGPRQAAVQWSFDNGGVAFVGAPVIDRNGVVYANTEGGELIAIAPDGTFRWRAGLASRAVGSPALAADGTIYATDTGGYLSAFTPDGVPLWRYHATGTVELRVGRSATAPLQPVPLDALGPAGTGPIVAPDGTIYYSLAVETWVVQGNTNIQSEMVQVVTPQGLDARSVEPTFLWSNGRVPRMLAGETALLWGLSSLRTLNATDPTAYYEHLAAVREAAGDDYLDILTFSGADGRTYLAYLRTLEAWYLTAEGASVSQVFTWNPETSPGIVADAGATPDGTRWMFFRAGKTIWIATDDGVIGPVRFPLESILVGVDRDRVLYGCGSSQGKAPQCMAFGTDAVDALWSVTLGDGDKVIGGALAEGRLFVITKKGLIYAIGDD